MGHLLGAISKGVYNNEGEGDGKGEGDGETVKFFLYNKNKSFITFFIE